MKRMSLDNFYLSVKDSISNLEGPKQANSLEYFYTPIIANFAYKQKTSEILYTFFSF